MTHRVLRIDVDLPALAPDQADLLWNLFDELAQKIWEAYEPEIFDLESERFGSRLHPQVAADPEAPSVTPSLPQPLVDVDEPQV